MLTNKKINILNNFLYENIKNIKNVRSYKLNYNDLYI